MNGYNALFYKFSHLNIARLFVDLKISFSSWKGHSLCDVSSKHIILKKLINFWWFSEMEIPSNFESALFILKMNRKKKEISIIDQFSRFLLCHDKISYIWHLSKLWLHLIVTCEFSIQRLISWTIIMEFHRNHSFLALIRPFFLFFSFSIAYFWKTEKLFRLMCDVSLQFFFSWRWVIEFITFVKIFPCKETLLAKQYLTLKNITPLKILEYSTVHFQRSFFLNFFFLL